MTWEELQEELNFINEMHIVFLSNQIHAPHIGLTCDEYERMITQGKADVLRGLTSILRKFIGNEPKPL